MKVVKFFYNLIAKKYPILCCNMRYLLRFGRFPNLKKPADINEKILWLLLFTDVKEWAAFSDKYKVKELLKQNGFENLLIPNIINEQYYY